MRGQGAILDALLFMVIASGAATLMIFVSGLYASSTNGQLMTIYNYEYAGNALIALHYAKDDQANWFWIQLRDKLASDTPRDDIDSYLSQGGGANSVWTKLTSSSPAGKNTYLCFEGSAIDTLPDQDIPCYGTPGGGETNGFNMAEPDSPTVYTSSVKITEDVKVILKLYY